jgi:hypothetical protein
MIIMALAYAQRSGDNSHLQTYYSLFLQWAEYLDQYTLFPADQVSMPLTVVLHSHQQTTTDDYAHGGA